MENLDIYNEIDKWINTNNISGVIPKNAKTINLWIYAILEFTIKRRFTDKSLYI